VSQKQSTIILSITWPNVDHFPNLFNGRFTSNSKYRAYATKSSLPVTIPPHLKRVAALHCETSISENYRKFDACIVINDKSQGSVATRLRSGELFSNCFTADSSLSLLGKQCLKSVNIWRSYGQYYSGLLWSPYGIGQTIIFLPCDFYLSFFLLLFLA